MQDLIIVGGGPAGLSAAINACAEGLSTTLLEAQNSFGGQARTSSRIENYLGFTNGESGSHLMHDSASQAKRLGADLQVSSPVTQLATTNRGWRVNELETTAVLLTVGVQWRRLPREHSSLIRYGATPGTLRHYHGRDVMVIGAANSAGQATLYLAEHGAKVHVLARESLMDMSAYLRDRLSANRAVEVHEHTELSALHGNSATLTSGETLTVAAVFPYIGAIPEPMPWLDGHCALDQHGFIQSQEDRHATIGSPGLFVAGDIRAGSRKRVAIAVGEGAMAAAEIVEYV